MATEQSSFSNKLLLRPLNLEVRFVSCNESAIKRWLSLEQEETTISLILVNYAESTLDRNLKRFMFLKSVSSLNRIKNTMIEIRELEIKRKVDFISLH